MPGLADILLILFVVFLIFGASKLPAIATAMGKTILAFRQKNESKVKRKQKNP